MKLACGASRIKMKGAAMTMWPLGINASKLTHWTYGPFIYSKLQGFKAAAPADKGDLKCSRL